METRHLRLQWEEKVDDDVLLYSQNKFEGFTKNNYGLIAHGFAAKYIWFYVKLKTTNFFKNLKASFYSYLHTITTPNRFVR